MEIKKWLIPDVDSEISRQIAGATSLSPFICNILAGRGFSPSAAAELVSGGCIFEDAYKLADMDKAVDRIRMAVAKGEKILIYGDYDCDGITSTALLYDYFDSLGADVNYYIPDREKEGYGLSLAAIDLIKQNKIDLIVTVDNGISAIEEIAYAATLGIDVVVTDHHKPREILPAAVAVVNPHRADDNSEFKNLAGVGVAFKLICAMEEDDGNAVLAQYGDIVSLGTIADCVPLMGENRAIVKHGLAMMSDTEHIGIAALIAAAGLEGVQITSESAAFGIVPRINAAGRIGSVDHAIELLLCGDVQRAQELAKELCSLNARRKDMEGQIMQDISARIQAQPQVLNQRVLVFGGEGWHHGLVGIVSSRIVERYGKPCLLFSLQGGEARGSCRSVDGYNIVGAISACSQLLIRYGGHTQAAGLTLSRDKLDEFTEQLLEYSMLNYDIMPIPTLRIDSELEPTDVTLRNIAYISALEPFGEGCPSPTFCIKNMVIETITPMGEGKHLRLRLGKNGQTITAAYFNMSPQRFAYSEGERVDIAFSMSANEWNGQQRVSVKIQDLRLSGIDQQKLHWDKQFYDKFCRGEQLPQEIAEAMEPTREDIALVYRFIKDSGSFYGGCDLLYLRLASKNISYLKLRLVVDIMLELDLISRGAVAGRSCLQIVERQGKADLSSSQILQKIKSMKMV